MDGVQGGYIGKACEEQEQQAKAARGATQASEKGPTRGDHCGREAKKKQR